MTKGFKVKYIYFSIGEKTVSKDFLNITDSRTDKSYELEINDGNIRARDLEN